MRGGVSLLPSAGSGSVQTGVDTRLLALSPYIACEADSISGSDGDVVSTWENPGSLADLTASGSARPTLRTGFYGINERAALEFDGSDDFFTLPSLAALTEATIILVSKLDKDPPATVGKTGLWNLGTDAVNGTAFPYTSGGIYEAAGTTSRKTTGWPRSDVPTLHRANIYTVVTAANRFETYSDGGLIFSTATNTVGFRAAPTLGKSLDGSMFDGRISAFYIFPVLSEANQRLAHGVLRAKYRTPA
jgi:hypothetical protein